MKSRKVLFSLVLALALVLCAGVALANEAKIGSQEYATIEKAFEEVHSNETITLLKDADAALKRYYDNASIDPYNPYCWLPNNNAKNCTIDLNGYTLTLLNNNDSADDYVFNTTTFKNGGLTLEEGHVGNSGLFWLNNSATLTFDQVTLTASGVDAYYAIFNLDSDSSKVKFKNDSELVINNSSNTPNVFAFSNTNNSISFDNSRATVSNVGNFLFGSKGSIDFENGSEATLTNVTRGLMGSDIKIDNSKVSISNASTGAVILNDNTVTLTNSSQLNINNSSKDITAGSGNSSSIKVDNTSILAAKIADGIESDIKTTAPILTDASNKAYVNGSATFTGTGSLVFKSTAGFEFFKRAAVLQNDKVVAEIVAPKLQNADGSIVVSDGSIKVTLDEKFLNTLDNGVYTIVIEDTYSDEGVSGTFNVAKPVALKGRTPQTGDNSNIALWISLMTISAAAFVVLGRKTRFN